MKTDRLVKVYKWLCWPCIFTGFLLSFVSVIAYAKAPGNSGPSWEIIGTGSFGTIVLLIGAYAKGMRDEFSRRVERLEEGFDATTRRLEDKLDEIKDFLWKGH